MEHELHLHISDISPRTGRANHGQVISLNRAHLVLSTIGATIGLFLIRFFWQSIATAPVAGQGQATLCMVAYERNRAENPDGCSPHDELGGLCTLDHRQ